MLSGHVTAVLTHCHAVTGEACRSSFSVAGLLVTFHASFPLRTAGLLLLHHRDAGDTRCAEGGWRGGQLSYRTGCDNHVDAEGCALPVIVCMYACEAACACYLC